MAKKRIDTNIIFDHLDSSKNKIVVEQGGTRSGKTYNILLWIIFSYCTKNKDKVVTVTRKTFPSVRATVMRDFIDILKIYGIYKESNHNKSSSEYKLFGNLVEFISLDQPQKVRGRKRDLLFINEANELFFEDWQQLIFRTTDKVILDFNPSDEFHWIYDKVITRDDADFYQTTYKDNPFLNETIVAEIERLRDTDEQYWRIYGLGERGVSRSTIFKYKESSKVPETAKFISYGMDYGYSNDPTAIVSVWQDGINLYIQEHLYRTHMTASDISKVLADIGVNRSLIYADSAEPRLNDELRRMGWNIRPSVKGKDSINAGIDLLKRYTLNLVTGPGSGGSDNLLREFRSYKWKEDRAGKLTNQPEDANNHLLDGLRYATYSILSRPNFGKYAIK